MTQKKKSPMAKSPPKRPEVEPAEPVLRGTPAPKPPSMVHHSPGGSASRLQPEEGDREEEPRAEPPTQMAEQVATQMRKLLETMTPEDALRIKAELGVVIPIRLTTEDKARNFAYKCNICQGRALEFVGEKFLFMRNDQLYEGDTPPIGVPIDEIPFVQERPDFIPKKNPLNIVCMHCHQPIQLNPDRSLRPMQIQRIDSKDEGPEAKRKRGQGVRLVKEKVGHGR